MEITYTYFDFILKIRKVGYKAKQQYCDLIPTLSLHLKHKFLQKIYYNQYLSNFIPRKKAVTYLCTEPNCDCQ
jgi:hypothetical protein